MKYLYTLWFHRHIDFSLKPLSACHVPLLGESGRVFAHFLGGCLDQLDKNAGWLVLAGLVLVRLVFRVGRVRLNAHHAAVLAASEEGSVSGATVAAAVDSVGDIGIEDGRVNAGANMLGQGQDGAGAGDGQGPLLAVGTARGRVRLHGPHGLQAFALVLARDLAQAGGHVPDVVGVDALRLAAVDSEADSLLLLAARVGRGGDDEGRAGEESGKSGGKVHHFFFLY
jgi:hypothetical protein